MDGWKWEDDPASFWDSLLAGAMFVSFRECNLVTFLTIGKKGNPSTHRSAGAFVGGLCDRFSWKGIPPIKVREFLVFFLVRPKRSRVIPKLAILRVERLVLPEGLSGW